MYYRIQQFLLSICSIQQQLFKAATTIVMETDSPFQRTAETSFIKAEVNVTPSKKKRAKLQKENYKTIQTILPNQTKHTQSSNKRKIISSKRNKEKNCWARSIHCLMQLLNCFREQTKPAENILVKQEDLLQTIQALRATQVKRSDKLLASVHGKIKTLVLDLEGTLTFSTRQRTPNCNFKCSVSNECTLYTKVRPGLMQFIDQISKLYEIVIFATSSKDTTDAILKRIDSKGIIKHRIYRESCISVNMIYYLKDMRLLNRDASDVIFVDPNIATGVLQPLNYLQIPYFTGDSLDDELSKLTKFLVWLSEQECIAPVYKHYEQYCDMQNLEQYNWTVCNSMQDCEQAGEISVQLLKGDYVISEESAQDQEMAKCKGSTGILRKQTQPTCESVEKDSVDENNKCVQQLSNIHNSCKSKDSDPFDYGIELDSVHSGKPASQQPCPNRDNSETGYTRRQKNKTQTSVLQQILQQVREEDYLRSQKMLQTVR